MSVWTKPLTSELVGFGVVLHTTTVGWTIVFGLKLVLRTSSSLIMKGIAVTFGTHLRYHPNTRTKRYSMIEVINNVFALILLSIFAWAVYESSKMIDEKKQRRKKGLTDYYDNPIVKDK
jgi:hypothetical protein